MTRPRSTLRRAAPAVAAAAVLGFGAWSGMALLVDAAPTGSAAPHAAATTVDPSTPPASTGETTRTPATRASTAPAVTGTAAFEAQVVTLVNTQRATAGCSALRVDRRLTSAARTHSADMATRGYFDHTTPDGVDFASRITHAGYRWSAAAENIAAGQRTPAAVMAAWMGSAGHRHNILDCGLRDIGVGLAYSEDGRPYWTQDFAAPA
jgi:uncharacterized protein YkwD